MNDVEIPTDLTKKILKRKAEPNAEILAHYYLEPEIGCYDDLVEDGVEFARKVNQINAERLVYN
jgi:quinolinate synthase